MLNYYIWTTGCQMNKAESREIVDCLDSVGYREVASFGKADLVVLNTCVVRQSAENKILGMLGLMQRYKRDYPEAVLAVTGCFAGSEFADLKKRFPHVDLFFKPGDYCELISWLKERPVSAGASRNELPCHLCRSVDRINSSLRRYISIIQGCNRFCSYCIVPYRRGRECSRPLEEIVCEIASLVEHGTREVILLGQNIGAYGHDLPERPHLAELLERLSGIENLFRIRFLTNHPKDVDGRLIEAVASLDKVCKHLDLPIQAGDDVILKSMKRGYTVKQYRELVGDIRKRVPDISLSTDVIAGFPGESDEQFGCTLALLEELKFDVVHVAGYSPRHGTAADSKYDDDVPKEVKKKRVKMVEALQAEVAAAINSQLMGKTMEVLVEGKKKEKWYGRTGTDKLVFFPGNDSVDYCGRMMNIEITRTGPWALQGVVEPNK